MAGGDAIGCARRHDLVELDLAIAPTLLCIAPLERPAPAAAAVVVGAVGRHVDEVLLADHGFGHEPQILGIGIAEGLAHLIAGVLDGELDLEVLVPVRIELEFALADPLRVKLNDGGDLELMGDFVLFQSGPDCEEFVPSLRVDPVFTAQVVHGLGLHLHNVLPALVIRQKHTVVFGRPAFRAVGPVGADRVQDLP